MKVKLKAGQTETFMVQARKFLAGVVYEIDNLPEEVIAALKGSGLFEVVQDTVEKLDEKAAPAAPAQAPDPAPKAAPAAAPKADPVTPVPSPTGRTRVRPAKPAPEGETAEQLNAEELATIKAEQAATNSPAATEKAAGEAAPAPAAPAEHGVSGVIHHGFDAIRDMLTGKEEK